MHRHRGVVVDPDDVVALQVAPVFADETAGGRGALAGPDARQWLVADAGHAVVTAREAQQNRRASLRAPLRVEHPQPRLPLVDHHERRIAVVSCGVHVPQCRLCILRQRGGAIPRHLQRRHCGGLRRTADACAQQGQGAAQFSAPRSRRLDPGSALHRDSPFVSARLSTASRLRQPFGQAARPRPRRYNRRSAMRPICSIMRFDRPRSRQPSSCTGRDCATSR